VPDLPAAALADGSQATFFLGTHRTRPPEETWRWIQPVLPLAGVTRVADVTALDCLGLPVYQAVRPASRNLSVSQGKAMTPVAAKVSAVMESVELWHSEKLDHLPQATVSLREMRYANPIGMGDLKWVRKTRLLEAMPMVWLEARSMTRDRHGWIPRRMVELDLTFPEVLEPQMFHRTSNGLASGNCLEEALIHALCEVVERHSLFLFYVDPFRRRVIDQESLRGTYCWPLVERIREAGMKLVLRDVTWEVGIPCVIADMVAPDLPNVWRGSGCHAAPEVAISRALNEAAQSRLTYISGARDDLTAFNDHVEPSSRYERYVEAEPEISLDAMARASSGNLQRDLDTILEALDAFGFEAFWMDFSRPEVGVPVVSVFVPGLREAPYG
jgi:ribosomal protein S12 methylthiotransferase accessory factor